jgi:glutamate formiminotransferase
MSEKRFIWKCDDENCHIFDTKEEKAYFNVEVVGLLNEQQATIDKVYELLKEEADIFSDEATEHDIKAYIELQEFDNKDAYYLACSIKKAIKLLKGDD